jgi:hypothetical protein
VQNYGIASQAQAEAGTDNASYMTPLRTAQAIAAKTGSIQFRINNNVLEYNNGGVWTPVALTPKLPKQAFLKQNSPSVNTYYTVISVTGKGILSGLRASRSYTAVARDVKFRVTIDGVAAEVNPITDQQSPAYEVSGTTGSGYTTNYHSWRGQAYFMSSIKVEVCITQNDTELACVVDYSVL